MSTSDGTCLDLSTDARTCISLSTDIQVSGKARSSTNARPHISLSIVLALEFICGRLLMFERMRAREPTLEPIERRRSSARGRKQNRMPRQGRNKGERLHSTQTGFHVFVDHAEGLSLPMRRFSPAEGFGGRIFPHGRSIRRALSGGRVRTRANYNCRPSHSGARVNDK